MSQENVFNVTAEERKAIYNTHNKTEKNLDEDTADIKNWLKKQSHLPQNEDDGRIKLMLVFNKFSLEKVKKKLDMYYSVKNMMPELFTNRETYNPLVEIYMNHIIWAPLPDLNKDLCRVFIFDFNGCAPDHFDTITSNKCFISSMDLRLVHDLCLGDHIIVNYKDLTLKLAFKFNLLHIQNTYAVFEKGYSDRIKGLHFINVSPYASSIIKFCNSLLSDKVANRIYIHKDLSTLHEHISKEILPVEYGRTRGNIKYINDEWKKFVESKNMWLTDEGFRRSDESKRIGEPFHSEELFGTYGSFRQINID